MANGIDPERIQDFLHELRNVTGWQRWMYGDCYKLYLMLKAMFPKAEAWYDTEAGHVYTKIGDLWYDINGYHEKLPKGSTKLKEQPNAARQAPYWAYEHDAVRHA